MATRFQLSREVYARTHHVLTFCLLALLVACHVTDTKIFKFHDSEYTDLACISRSGHSVALIPVRVRDDIPTYLNTQDEFTVGAELGVKTGDYKLQLLSRWTNCKKMYLIDLWAHLENYKDTANQNNETHLQYMSQARVKLANYEHKTEFIRARTDVAVTRFVNHSLDFIYVDARHDYCGVSSDLRMWWPKLRPGGIMTGHDYTSDVSGQDWTLCEDGHREKGSVKRAVNEFAEQHGLAVVVTYAEKIGFPSYMMRKHQ